MPTTQAQLPLAGFIYKLLGIWFVLALLMMPLLWWLLARILKPLDYLESQIGEVGKGERASLDLATSMQELQQVAMTFNRVEHERQQLVGHLQERQAFLDSVLSATPQGMFVANFGGKITYMNPALLEMLDIPPDMPMEVWMEQVHPDDREGARDMWVHSLKTGSDFVRQLRFVRSDHETLWLDIHARVVMLSQGGHSLGLVGVVKDITERRQQEALQRWEAEHDPLTGLLNRRGFERRLEEAFADFQKTSTPSALLLFDLDHFKPINDEGGHALGDEMLRRIAQIVAWEVRGSDHVARQGGDEFAVLLPSCTLGQAERIAESLRQSVSEVTVTHEGKEYSVTLSIGVTTFDECDETVDVAISRADAASYEAKGGGARCRGGQIARTVRPHRAIRLRRVWETFPLPSDQPLGERFGGHGARELLSQEDDTLYDRTIIFARQHIANEVSIDFDQLHRQAVKVRQRRVAGAEIVQRHVDPQPLTDCLASRQISVNGRV
ncbi:hypothetical protein HAALTHF_30030n [Vreelandella aquamarina]|nr:hypothetical protein HAALTHF_30030n [Halomonas axialensis]